MRDLFADLRYATRALLARRSFAVAAILTLTLGVGLTTAIFSIVSAVVLRPLPLPEAGRLVAICELYPGATPDWCSAAAPNVEDVAARARTLDAIGVGRSWSVTWSTPDGADNLYGGIATPGMFRALGFRAERGRLLEAADLTGGPGTVAVISHEMWQTRFAGAADIVGRSLVLDGAPVTVVGVIAPGFDVPLFEGVQIWRPLHINPRSEQHRAWRGFVVYARLREGISLSTASAELAGIARDLKAAHFPTTEGWNLTARPLQDLVVGNVRGPMLMFFGAVGLVLLVACVNVANLVLARGATRTREIAVRAAIGASRGRIIRSLLMESLLLSLAGSVVGLLFSDWATQVFKSLAPPGIPRLDLVSTNLAVVAFAAAVAIATALVFGLAPAMRLSRVDLANALRESGRAVTGPGRLGRVLVVAELAIALPLVTGAALLARSFSTLTSWQPGFEQEHLATFTLFLPSTAYDTRAQMADRWDRLEAEIASIPGVERVGTASAGPLFGAREAWEMRIEGRAADALASIRWYDVSPGFFRTLGVPLVRGRDFGPDDRFGAPSAALVNETLVKRFWPNDDPIGKRLVFPVGDQSETYTVVGVVRDVPPLHPGSAIEPEIYWSNRQSPRPFTYFLVRTTVPPAAIAAEVRERVKGINRDFLVSSFSTYPETVGRRLSAPRFNLVLIATFGVAALLLAGIGTYGMLAYFVEQRRKDIGILLALGARPRRVVLDVLRSGLTLAVVGIALGTVASISLGRLISGLQSGVSAQDPGTLSVSALIVLAVAAGACLVPAWRASRVDPATALGAE